MSVSSGSMKVGVDEVLGPKVAERLGYRTVRRWGEIRGGVGLSLRDGLRQRRGLLALSRGAGPAYRPCLPARRGGAMTTRGRRPGAGGSVCRGISAVVTPWSGRWARCSGVAGAAARQCKRRQGRRSGSNFPPRGLLSPRGRAVRARPPEQGPQWPFRNTQFRRCPMEAWGRATPAQLVQRWAVPFPRRCWFKRLCVQQVRAVALRPLQAWA